MQLQLRQLAQNNKKVMRVYCPDWKAPSKLSVLTIKDCGTELSSDIMSAHAVLLPRVCRDYSLTRAVHNARTVCFPKRAPKSNKDVLNETMHRQKCSSTAWLASGDTFYDVWHGADDFSHDKKMGEGRKTRRKNAHLRQMTSAVKTTIRYFVYFSRTFANAI